MRIIKLKYGLAFLPDSNNIDKIAIFTHGYTSHKNSILNWAIRIIEQNMAVIIFDLPGHILGLGEEVCSLEEFFKKAISRFELSIKELKINPKRIVLGGHSLGALISIYASNLSYFKNKDVLVIAIGLELAPENKKHIFESSLFNKTMKIRSHFVSRCLHPSIFLPYLKKIKDDLKVSNQNITIINGKDDIIIEKSAGDRLAAILSKENTVTVIKVNKLPHHMPELAIPHIKKILKINNLI